MAFPANHVDLLDPAAVARLGQLELIATRIVEGFVAGKHRSPYRGCSVEFAEHRGYSPGDELRLIDWRVLARSDRYYIKQYEEETNLQAMLVVDASGSMGFGLKTVPKWRYAQMAAACLARMMLHQCDAVGLAMIGANLNAYVPPRSTPGHLKAILDVLGNARAGGDASLAGHLHDLTKRLKRRGMFMIFSDCFEDLDLLLNALHHLRARGHETLLFHIMAPEELTFDLGKWSQFEDLEGAAPRIELDPRTVRKMYLEQVKAFLDRLQAGCGEVRCEYIPLTTDRPLADTLAYYLARRAARMK
jgi:uncharacterized protein (DUF58 family)